MADVSALDGEIGAEVEAPKKKSKLPLILGLFLAIALGGGGFFAVYSGLLLAPKDASEEMAKDMPKDGTSETSTSSKIAFVPLQPLVINLGSAADNRHLKFNAQLEVISDAEAEVTNVLPRITDVINGYLRAVDVDILQEPAALVKIRGQLLRRIKVVTGQGRVRDLLIMEFVLN